MTKYVLMGYLVVMNIAAFALFAADKRRAVKKMWRIPEFTLLTAAALGGSLGALLGMHLLRHKTKRAKFYLMVPACFFLQVFLFAYLFLRFSGKIS